MNRIPLCPCLPRPRGRDPAGRSGVACGTLLCCLLGGRGSRARRGCFPRSHSSASLGLQCCWSVPACRRGKARVPCESFPRVHLNPTVPPRGPGSAGEGRAPSSAALHLCSRRVCDGGRCCHTEHPGRTGEKAAAKIRRAPSWPVILRSLFLPGFLLQERDRGEAVPQTLPLRRRRRRKKEEEIKKTTLPRAAHQAPRWF